MTGRCSDGAAYSKRDSPHGLLHCLLISLSYYTIGITKRLDDSLQ